MDCAEEVAILRREMEPLEGVANLTFDVLNARMTVEFDANRLKPGDIELAVRRTGMRAEPWRESSTGQEQTTFWDRWGRTSTTALSAASLLTGLVYQIMQLGPRSVLDESIVPPLFARVAYLLAIVAGAWYVAPKAVLAARRLRPDMNLLMVVAIAGAVLIGQWLEGATVAFLFALSLTLEAWSVSRARRAIESLLALTPPQARVLKDGREELIEAVNVAVGSTVVVRPGEKIPLDGTVTKGETTINQAPITGESLPVPKSKDSPVFAGTLNEDGVIEFTTTKPASDTTIARIIRMVGEAQTQRAVAEQWVDRFARYYTPTVMLLAVATALIPPIVFGAGWQGWFYQALVLLVIACPCALVISTPVSIVAALTAAARHGVLIKGGVYVEMPSQLSAIAMDKTGTLTLGKPRVQKVVSLSGHTQEELLAIGAAIEARSQHPLARAVVEYASESGVRVTPAEDFQAIKGKGVTSRIDGEEYWLGSHRYLEERGGETREVHEQLESLSRAGQSVVVIGNSRHICGFLAIADQVRPGARDIVGGIKSAGIRHVVMLTGDNEGTAAAIAEQTGVDEYRAELLPEDKVSAVEALGRKYGRVAMVGDGVNDAPAMAKADLGIAMGAIGTDAAIETADIALMSDDLARLPWLILHSRRTMRIIRQNIVASIGIKIVFVVLTFAGYASLWAAITADTGMSLVVIFNALRLLERPRNDA